MTPALRSDSGVMVVSPKVASFSRFTMLYSTRKMFVNPRFGMRRCSGIWPPSKPRIMREPLRERWPLCPRVEVLPMPEPMPRPTRFLPSFAFFGARTFERFIRNSFSLETLRLYVHNLLDLNQVRDLCHHAADGRRIRTFNHLIQSREPQALDDQLMFHRSTDRGPHPLQMKFAGRRAGFLCCHSRLPSLYISSMVLPRIAATSDRFLSFFNASKVALM